MNVKLFLVAAIAATSVGAVSAEPIPTIDITTLRRLTRPGPHGVEFSNRVKFRVPDNLRYVTEDKLEQFMEKVRLPVVGDEAGVVVPEDVNWLTIVYLPKDDPLANQADLANLDRQELMKWQEKFTADHSLRNAGTSRSYTLGNWTHPPKWDPEKKTLEMGVRLASDTGNPNLDLIDHKIFVYGPDKQIVLLDTRAPMTGKWDGAVKQAKKLQDELTAPPSANEGAEGDELMYYGKLAAGGLLGTMLVMVIAKLATGRRTTAGARRPGLPR